jgi:hypothetical protein
VRRAAGGFDLGIGDEGGGRTSDLVRRLVPSAAPDATLRRLEVRDAEVVAVEPASGRTWRGLHVEMTVEPRHGGVGGTLRGDLDLGGAVVPVRGELVYRPGGSSAALHFGDVLPAEAGAQFPDRVRALVATVAVPLAGDVQLDLDGAFTPTRIRVHLDGRAGTVRIPELLASPVGVRGVELSAALDVAADTFAVERLALDLPDARIEAHGTLAELHGARRVELRMAVAQLRVRDLATYWPKNVARPTREWVATNVAAGTVRDAAARITARVGDAELVDTDARVTMMLEKVALRSVGGMPAMRDLAGTASFGTSAFSARIARGTVGDLQVVHGTVDVNALKRRATVRAALRGPLAGALAMVDGVQPGRSLGIASADGTVDADVRLDVPLRTPFRARDIAVAVAAKMRGVAIPRAVRGWSFSDGELDADLHGGALAITGRGRVEGVPISLAWKDDADGSRRIDVTARVDSAQRAALGVDLRYWLDGPALIRAAFRESRNAGSLDVDADLSEATVSLAVLAVAKSPGVPARAEARVALARGIATHVERFAFATGGTSVTGRAALASAGTALHSLDLSATIAPREVGHAPGHVRFTIGGAGDARHPFNLTSDDAGALFRAIAPAAEATGGHLRYAGTIEVGARGTPLDGRLELHDFRMKRSPLLARVATLASLSGIAQLLQGQGIVFDRFEAGIASRGTTVTLTDAVARGPSANVLIAGTIERAERTASLRGTLVPSFYGVNTAAGRVPVVGRLITGQQREGIQAFDFEVTGPVASPRVSVRFSSLAPGVLRDLARRVSGVRR